MAREDDGYVERQTDGVALNLHIAFLHDVEERDLDLAGEVGQLVDGEDAAVGARQQAVVHGELGAEVLVRARGFDGVDVADEVGYGDVGSGQLFYVALVWGEPRDGRLFAHLRDEVAAELRDRRIGIVAQLGAGDVRAGAGRAGVVSARRMRDLACPRSPSRMKLCLLRTALTIWGTTVSS